MYEHTLFTRFPTNFARRTTTPASSLKERIAALQQRSTSPQSSPPRKVATRVPAPKNSLRDKIARFEEKGGASKSSGE